MVTFQFLVWIYSAWWPHQFVKLFFFRIAPLTLSWETAPLGAKTKVCIDMYPNTVTGTFREGTIWYHVASGQRLPALHKNLHSQGTSHTCLIHNWSWIIRGMSVDTLGSHAVLVTALLSFRHANAFSLPQYLSIMTISVGWKYAERTAPYGVFHYRV